jgi:hypothetical protein
MCTPATAYTLNIYSWSGSSHGTCLGVTLPSGRTQGLGGHTAVRAAGGAGRAAGAAGRAGLRAGAGQRGVGWRAPARGGAQPDGAPWGGRARFTPRRVWRGRSPSSRLSVRQVHLEQGWSGSATGLSQPPRHTPRASLSMGWGARLLWYHQQYHLYNTVCIVKPALMGGVGRVKIACSMQCYRQHANPPSHSGAGCPSPILAWITRGPCC